MMHQEQGQNHQVEAQQPQQVTQALLQTAIIHPLQAPLPLTVMTALPPVQTVQATAIILPQQVPQTVTTAQAPQTIIPVRTVPTEAQIHIIVLL